MMTMTRTRYIPKDAREIQHPAGLGVAYASESVNARGRTSYAVMAYQGKATKSAFYEGYGTAEARDKRISDWFSSLTNWEAQKAQFRADRNRPTTLKPGDIVCNSWGWEQTNIDFFEVVRVTDHFVWLRQLCQETTEKGFMQGQTIPTPGRYVMPREGQPAETKHKSAGERVNFEYGSGSKWDGRPQWCSWYA